MKRALAIAITSLLVAAAPASADLVETFSNTAPISVPGNGGTIGPGAPYPSGVVVDNRSGPVTDVVVTLRRVNLEAARDVRIVLESPTGRTATVMNSNCGTGRLVQQNLVVSEDALKPMPVEAPCTEVAYQPNPTTTAVDLPAPARPAPYGVSLDVFNGANPNGTWKLYTQDKSTGDSGVIEGGWTLTLSTKPEAVDMRIPAAGTFYVASHYPSMVEVTGETGVVTDLNVILPRIWHQRPADLDLLLEGPQGQRVILMSDACAGVDPEGASWTFDDEADLGIPQGGMVCQSRSFRPKDYEPGETWPAPAPSGPHETELSAFDLTDPNGVWRLYATDDETGAFGFITNRFRLEMTTRPRAEVAFTEPGVRLVEGQSRELTLRRSGTDLLAASVSVATTPGSAGSPEDFTPIATTVEFAAGEAERTVRIDARQDRDTEGSEAYGVVISSVTGDAAVGDRGSVAVRIAALRCAGRLATITGTPGRDILRGTGRRDVIIGLGGNDTVRSRGAGDVVCTGRGADRVLGASGRDLVLGGAGRDRLFGGGGADSLLGGKGRDVLAGGRGRDSCRGGAGRDRATCEASR